MRMGSEMEKMVEGKERRGSNVVAVDVDDVK